MHQIKDKCNLICCEINCVYLEVGYPNCCNHSKHNKEHAPNDWIWDSDKNCSKLSKDSQDDHQNSSSLEDQPATNLTWKQSTGTHCKVYTRKLKPSLFLQGCWKNLWGSLDMWHNNIGRVVKHFDAIILNNNYIWNCPVIRQGVHVFNRCLHTNRNFFYWKYSNLHFQTRHEYKWI